MTLSATGDAETPAGGSVCIRCATDGFSKACSDLDNEKMHESNPGASHQNSAVKLAYLEISH